jgi:DHA1 family bicyclomycin/chloramphenicol resistance-like MFS transporter
MGGRPRHKSAADRANSNRRRSRDIAPRPKAGEPTAAFALSLASIALIGPLAVHLFLPVIPAVKEALALSDAAAQSTFSVSLLGMAGATLVYGDLSDRWGRRPVLLCGLALFLVGSVLSMVAGGFATLAFGRLTQAIGAGCSITLVRAIARDAYGPERLVKAIAYLTMFYTLGPAIAPIAGGFLVDAFGWRAAFAVSLVGGAAIFAGAWTTLYETRPAGAGGGGAFANMGRLLATPRFLAFVLQTGFNTGSFFVTAAAASFLMKDTLGRGAGEFGLWFLSFPLGFFCGNFVSGRIGPRASIEAMTLVGAASSLLAIGLQSALLLSGHLSPAAIFIPGFFLTFAQGISLPYAQAGAMNVVPRLAGTASGIGVCMQNLIGAGSTAIYGLMSDGTVTPLAIVASVSGVLGVIAGAAPWVLKRRATGG